MTKNFGEKIMLLISLGFIGATAVATLFTLSVMFLTAWIDHADAVAERNQQTYCTWPEVHGPNGCYIPKPDMNRLEELTKGGASYVE
ncbi:hypothetical protein [Abiotrophia defectiva]|uniref:hypothetical protein n=1 Tax=Abiotrophia defectiva TaxID=46125 RepID=UPI0026E9BD23|nr:hypothetical protein [Abiotrophia defectiva]